LQVLNKLATSFSNLMREHFNREDTAGMMQLQQTADKLLTQARQEEMNRTDKLRATVTQQVTDID